MISSKMLEYGGLPNGVAREELKEARRNRVVKYQRELLLSEVLHEWMQKMNMLNRKIRFERMSPQGYPGDSDITVE